ncbi:Hypothetical protein SRAE_X000237000 [Strongyloides ratti]|uniref:Uncharacterized protein n=1 Tax=Strongyloides ratti TaxID=34506 RepID=A0A090KTA3_STRRB|nr:Hypothetical protein SRAE_X000237000 [Strongyloides ratti]CEF60636.1 Hypothetical protein SRAE_X000237000 [Strongyloides ratti]
MISKKEDVAIGNAIWIMMERIEEHCKRIYNKKMNRRRQEPDMEDGLSTGINGAASLLRLFIQDRITHNPNEWCKTGGAVQNKERRHSGIQPPNNWRNLMPFEVLWKTEKPESQPCLFTNVLQEYA